MAAQPEMYTQIMLRKVAPAAQYFAHLNQVSGYGSHARVQGQMIALHSYAFQLEADPMVLRASFGAENHWLANQIFNHRLHLSVVEKIAHGQSATYLRELNRVANQLAGAPEGAVSLIDKQKLRLQVPGGRVSAVHLRIYVSVHQKEIFPAVVGKIDESVTPAHISLRAPGNARRDRRINKIHSAIVHSTVVAIKGGVLIVKMRKQQRHAPGMQIVAERNSHIGLFKPVFVRSHAGSQRDIHEFSRAVALIQVVGLAIVGNKEIELSIIVEI